ncbi:MAG: ATP-binding protein [Candidatus Omnitrophica bacterium]|nr:ATP-binding protein [Candidatus Omnitrophota bacterium]
MRRTGKTTLLNFFYEKIESKNKLFLDLENPLNRKYFEEKNYEKIKKTFEFLGIDFSKKTYIFCDEIQFVRNLPSVVKYFIDHYKVKFFLTGSASFYLKNLFSESLSGRKIIFELYPLTFREFLSFKNFSLYIPEKPQEITPAIFETILPLYEEYLLFGGFPGVVLKNIPEEKKKALEEIFTSFFQLEVIQIGYFRRNEIIRDLILLLMQRIGNRLDIQRLSKELGASRATLEEYLSFLEGTYFIKTIRPFSRKKDTEIRKARKVYLCDTGLVNHFVRIDEGLLYENAIFQNLRMQGEINYYQKKSGVEIDFILNREKAYEVKLTPRETDLKKLKIISEELKLKEYWIVSKRYSELKNIIYGFMV